MVNKKYDDKDEIRISKDIMVKEGEQITWVDGKDPIENMQENLNAYLNYAKKRYTSSKHKKNSD